VSVDKLKPSTLVALQHVAGPARRAGLDVEFSGGVVATAKSSDSGAELVGVVAAFVILLVTLGTVLAAVLPLAIALVGVAVGLLGICAVSGLTTLNSTAPTLATMLGLAVGIDYSLFIVSRHRQQVIDGLEPLESVGRAVGAAGSAVWESRRFVRPGQHDRRTTSLCPKVSRGSTARGRPLRSTYR
jgi:RND superfamily putative drug exporter